MCVKNEKLFIKNAIKIHGNEYDYSLVDYKNSKTKVKIICKIHGLFEQIPNNHTTKKSGCPQCYQKNKFDSINTFINKANNIHKNKYNYSSVDYKNSKTKVKIICFDHGIFLQEPRNHLRGSGCPTCKGVNRISSDEYIKKVNKIHNDKYNYSLVDYKNSYSKIKIICKKHGIFEQIAHGHFYHGCEKCYDDNHKMNYNKFILKAKKIHNDKYVYLYIFDFSDKISIICPIHGEFKQNYNNHLQGQGCPICRESKGEQKIRNILLKKKIKFIIQKRFNDCRNKKPLPFDFYLPELNICIEFDGIQHFETNHFGDEQDFYLRQKHDKIKTLYCKNNGINLIRIKYNDIISQKIDTICLK